MITGDDVRSWRTYTRVSTRRLARLLHAHPSTIFRWEAGRHAISHKYQGWLMVLFTETARRQPYRPHMHPCPHCQGTGLIPDHADDAQTAQGHTDSEGRD